MDRQILAQYGISYENGLHRFMNNTALYERFLLKFLDDGALVKAQAALDANDEAELMARVHEIKGVSGNLNMDDLYEAASSVVACLRKQNDHDLKADFAIFAREYNRAKEGIEAAKA